MSALAPTTYKSFGDRFGEDALAYNMLSYLDPRDLKRAEKVSKECEKQVHTTYLDAYRLRDRNSEQELSRNALLSVREACHLMGGEEFVQRVTENGAISVFHLSVQKALRELAFNYRLIGLAPFLQATPRASQLLKEVKKLATNEERYWKLIDWIKNNSANVAAVWTVRSMKYRLDDLRDLTKPLYHYQGEDLQDQRVYHLVPEAICYFTGLEHLILDDNRLVSLPEEISKIPSLKTLSLKNNFFKEMPPPIKTLNKLYLSGNSYSFEPMQIYWFFKEYIDCGGRCIEVHFDEKYFDPEYQEIIEKVASLSDLELTIEWMNFKAIFTLSKPIEPTQVLSLEDE